MNLRQIQELIKFVAKSGATEVDLEIDNVKISIKSPPKKRRGKEEENIEISQQIPAQIISTPVAAPVAAPAPLATTDKKEKSEKTSKNNSNDESNYVTIKASMIGTFYRSSSPESDPFINVGDSINKGDTICIIEAMKLFNEIESNHYLDLFQQSLQHPKCCSNNNI